MKNIKINIIGLITCLSILACSAEDLAMYANEVDDGENGNQDAGNLGWPDEPNAYSWDGSWSPLQEDLPPDGLFDKCYFDGHDVNGMPSPILPPGQWDWDETTLLANWKNFASTLGTFNPLQNLDGGRFGWRLMRINTDGIEAADVMQYFYGSSGTDIIDLGPVGAFVSAGDPLYGSYVNFGDGPDMLRYRMSYSAAVRTGSSLSGHLRDNDLAVIGSNDVLSQGECEIFTTGLHTGPGSDLVFVNNMAQSVIDLGNGDEGRTDVIDPYDSRDIVVIGGNAEDFRVFGGGGNDMFVWNIEEIAKESDDWFGPSFFGAGAWGEALWNERDTDRLVLVISPDTTLVSNLDDNGPGTLLVMIYSEYEAIIDTRTEDDPYKRYYLTAPPGPDGQKTMVLQYQSPNGSLVNAYLYITDIEELQIGSGPSAVVYALNDVTGTFKRAPALQVAQIPSRTYYEELMDSFLE